MRCVWGQPVCLCWRTGPNKARYCWAPAADFSLAWGWFACVSFTYIRSSVSQRCKNAAPSHISLPSAKCGQNWLASQKFNRVRTDRQHYSINWISFRIQARNTWWGVHAAVMCFKTVWNNVVSRNVIFRIVCSAYKNTSSESCCVHVY